MIKASKLLIWFICLLEMGSWSLSASPRHQLASRGNSPAVSVRFKLRHRRLPVKAFPLKGIETVIESQEDADADDLDTVGLSLTLVSELNLFSNGLAIPSSELGWVFRPQMRSPLLRC
ncbi:MAG TPA: hypothetical protein VGZ22_04555 [Isosphaeraceae bacterium]|jgi:hypothetical protein|nr:hypothetical protein [Isosphaeraceae bacterium]